MNALQESDLGNYQNNLAGSSGQGLFQFMEPEHNQNSLIGTVLTIPKQNKAVTRLALDIMHQQICIQEEQHKG